MSDYFPSLNSEHCNWIRNPFMETSSDFDLTLIEEEELASISTDRVWMIKHKGILLLISIKEECVDIYI